MSGAPKPRRTASLAKSLDEQLNRYTLESRANCPVTYAAAVGVAGAAVMSLAPIAEARIIYTPVHVKIPQSSYVFIDFNYGPEAGDYDFGIVKGGICRSLSGCVSGMGAGGYTTLANFSPSY